MKVSLSELMMIVDTNDKRRYQLVPNPKNFAPGQFQSDNPSHHRIRASQGHSIATITSERLLIPVLITDPDCPALVVHGTFAKDYEMIKRSGGLKSMKRNHIHFATKEPTKLKPIGLETEVCKTRDVMQDKDKLLSGMRQGATILIWVDVKKSLQGGVKWWRSQNNVFLTEGLERAVSDAAGAEAEREEKILGFEWFRWVEKRKGEDMEVLWKAEGAEPKREKAENEMRTLSIGTQSQVGTDAVADMSENELNGEKETGVVKVVEPDGPVKEHWDD